MNNRRQKSPWSWIPTLYFAEGLPNIAVATISVIMYKRMGISNGDITLFTSLLYLPWVIKPLWSPFVDILKTKYWWIVSMQLFIGIVFASIAFIIPLSFFFQATLFFFWLLAFSSATHDIAADGFYMLALDSNSQAKFVGIRSTFYRLATIMGQGLLIILAGFIESNTGMKPLDIRLEASPKHTQSSLVIPVLTENIPQKGTIHFITDKAAAQLSTTTLPKDSAQSFIAKISALNKINGFVHVEEKSATTESGKESWWTSSVSKPLGHWIKSSFGEEHSAIESAKSAGNVAVVAIKLSQKPEEDKEILLNTSMAEGDKSITLVEGEHLAFNQENWSKTAYLVFQLDPKLRKEASVVYKSTSGNIPFAWSTTFFVLAGLFVLMSFYHRKALPKADETSEGKPTEATAIFAQFNETFKSFFKKPHALAAIFFMLTFRFSEAQVLKLINPFLLDSRDVGGLGLTTGEVGLVYGSIGIVGLTLGGIIGGFAAAKGGLKKWIWPMTLSMLLTILAFVYLSFSQTHNFFIINTCVFVEQFGYGFGFTAYMLYLIYFSEGEHKTAHYAFCTGFMALGMMLPGMFAGWLQEILGYNHFFVWAVVCSIIPVIAVSLLKIDPEFGKAKKEQ